MLHQVEKPIAEAAFREGFALVGFAPLKRIETRHEFFHQWLQEGRAADMGWLAREPERRLNPGLLEPRLRGVISLAYAYEAPKPPAVDWRTELCGRIAAYAMGPDYHDTVLASARRVAAALMTLRPAGIARIYVDTGPVLEREWAAAARLGWFGRNTNLLNRYHGSYFFLAEIFTDLEFDGPTQPYREHCGSCRQCLDLCPTQALTDGYLLEPRRCISYLTIEHRGAIPLPMRAPMSNWIFGCDICQEVCPWNSDAMREAKVNPQLAPSLAWLMELDEQGFRQCYGKSAVRRTKRRGLLRNAAIALGNSGNPRAVPILARVLQCELEPLVRAHAAWALGCFDTAAARAALDSACASEPDGAVKLEIGNALEQRGA